MSVNETQENTILQRAYDTVFCVFLNIEHSISYANYYNYILIDLHYKLIQFFFNCSIVCPNELPNEMKNVHVVCCNSKNSDTITLKQYHWTMKQHAIYANFYTTIFIYFFYTVSLHSNFGHSTDAIYMRKFPNIWKNYLNLNGNWIRCSPLAMLIVNEMMNGKCVWQMNVVRIDCRCARL